MKEELEYPGGKRGLVFNHQTHLLTDDEVLPRLFFFYH